MDISINDIIQRAAHWQKKNVSFSLATITKTSGATPGRVGFKMIVFEDGSIEGTVGGGEIEKQIIETARECFKTKQNVNNSYELTEQGIGMKCGGKLDAFIEYFPAQKTIYLFGGGHLCQSIVPILKTLSFKIVVVDNRNEVISEEIHPQADELICSDYTEFCKSLETKSNDSIVIFTHGHKHDFSVISEILKKDLSYRYLGMIGSREKVNGTKMELKNFDISQKKIAEVFAPIGLNIARRTTQEIAIAIVAEIIAVYNGVDKIKFMRD